MSHLASCVTDVMDRIRKRHDAAPGEFWRACLFWTFWVSLALFPIGYGWREVTPPLCFIFLLLYYRQAWQGSVLRLSLIHISRPRHGISCQSRHAWPLP